MTAAGSGSPPEDNLNGPFGKLYDVIVQLPVGLLFISREGLVLGGTPRAAAHLDRSIPDLIGADFAREVLPEVEERGLADGWREALARGDSIEAFTVEVQTSRGEQVLNVTPVRIDGGGEPVWIAVLEDRTSLVEEERRRRRAESLASVGELAAGLAHEVNNPLASIKSLAQLLAWEAPSGEKRHALELIIQESDRIGRAVENLVAFARQQGASGREPVNLSTLVERVIQVRRYSLEAAGVEVRMDLDSTISLIMGEPGALQQAILNLVTRAENDLASRRADRMLIVRTRESSEGVVLYVVDNGPGIPKEVLPRLFDVYGPAGEGHQLELATSARIIRDHGGYIIAESEAGRGSAFFVRLPRAGAPPMSGPPAEAVSAAPQPRRALRVLVADDEPTLRLAISLFLHRRGHQVTQASDAYEALQLAKDHEFDVALVDARMPGDGLALLEQLEAMPSLAGRTALMTGDLGRARTTQGIPTGRPYLVKPFDMNEAVNLLEKLADQDPT